MTSKFSPVDTPAVPLYVIEQDALDTWLSDQTDLVRNWVASNGFSAGLGQVLTIPDATGQISTALAGFGTEQSRARGRFHLAAAAAKLPEGAYVLQQFDHDTVDTEALGWLLSAYVFDRYSDQKPVLARLVAPQNVDVSKLESIAAGECLTRDLINTPTSDMGPVELEAAAAGMAERFGAQIDVIRGEALLEKNFPLIHAVGRASAQAPRLIDMTWGQSGPKLTLVGKGVCFDTGGLNLKSGASMGLMKKDMGGAATVMGLAQMIMALDMPLQLRMLIPAVENAVSGNATRPGDILTARNGLTVEVNNTDAEGRLVLADALSLGTEDMPDMMISMATLTGAARVAVGADIAPYFCDDQAFVQGVEDAAKRVADPVWRLPFYTPYESMIEPGIADLDNAPKGGFAGSITAALFLRRFVGAARYAHFDIYGWNPTAAPARPKGGVGMGARALLDAMPELLGL